MKSWFKRPPFWGVDLCKKKSKSKNDGIMAQKKSFFFITFYFLDQTFSKSGIWYIFMGRISLNWQNSLQFFFKLQSPLYCVLWVREFLTLQTRIVPIVLWDLKSGKKLSYVHNCPNHLDKLFKKQLPFFSKLYLKSVPAFRIIFPVFKAKISTR